MEDDNDANASFSSSMESCSIIKEFINKYEQLPELWDIKHPHYTNKNKRNAAYDVLLLIMKKCNLSSTRFNVRQKINSLRSNYRKELRKYLASKTIGPDGKEVFGHIPASWKFYALRFLDNTEKEENVTTNNIEEIIVEEPTTYEDPSDASSSCVESPYVENTSKYSYIRKRKKVRRKKRLKLDEDFGSVDADNVSNSEFEAIGANVAFKLKRMNSQQRCRAELLINKVLINGLQNNLTDDTDLKQFKFKHSASDH